MNSRLKCNGIGKEYLVWSSEAQAFSWGRVVAEDILSEVVWSQQSEVCFSGQEAAEAPDGVFDAAFLPGRMSITEPGSDAVFFTQAVVLAEFLSVVECDGPAAVSWQPTQQGGQIGGDARSGFGGLAQQQSASRLAFMDDQQKLALFGEAHEVGLPMTRLTASMDAGGAVVNGSPVQYGRFGPASSFPAVPPAVFMTREQAVEGSVERPTAPVNVAIDRFVTDRSASLLPGHSSCDLFRLPALGEAGKDFFAERGKAFQLMGSTARMPAGSEQMSSLRIIAARPLMGRLAVAPEFAANGRNAAT